MISNFPEIRQNLRISGGNIGNILCIYCFIVCEISRRENCCCGYSFRRDENSTQNESWVLFAHFRWTINDRRHERNKAKGLIIMIIIYEFIKRKCLCNYNQMRDIVTAFSVWDRYPLSCCPTRQCMRALNPHRNVSFLQFSFIYGWPLVNTGEKKQERQTMDC